MDKNNPSASEIYNWHVLFLYAVLCFLLALYGIIDPVPYFENPIHYMNKFFKWFYLTLGLHAIVGFLTFLGFLFLYFANKSHQSTGSDDTNKSLNVSVTFPLVLILIIGINIIL